MPFEPSRDKNSHKRSARYEVRSRKLTYEDEQELPAILKGLADRLKASDMRDCETFIDNSMEMIGAVIEGHLTTAVSTDVRLWFESMLAALTLLETRKNGQLVNGVALGGENGLMVSLMQAEQAFRAPPQADVVELLIPKDSSDG
jgi:hypothetical protein